MSLGSETGEPSGRDQEMYPQCCLTQGLWRNELRDCTVYLGAPMGSEGSRAWDLQRKAFFFIFLPACNISSGTTIV